MTVVLAVCVAVILSVSIYLMLARELKSIAMGVFLMGHAANLAIIAMSGSPVHNVSGNPGGGGQLKRPPILTEGVANTTLVDPLPQALILTAIVISFAVMGFLLTLIVMTGRKTETLNVDELSEEQRATPSH